MLNSNMKVHIQKYERPQQDSQNKGEQLADSMDRISVRKRHYHADK